MTAATLLSLLLLAAPPSARKEAEDPLRLTVVVAGTAQLFHVVDQLSGWSPYSHAQYRAHFADAARSGLSAEDEALLARYAAMRKRLGYGALDAALYTDRPLKDALGRAVAGRALTAADAALVEEALGHFAPRVQPLLGTLEPAVRAYAARVEALARSERDFVRAAATFFSVKKVEVPIFVVASPGKGFGGGGFNGGRLVVEVGEGAEGAGPLLHELWHAFGEARRPDLVKAAARVPGLDFETVSEALAYAVAPGLWAMSPGAGDELEATVRADLQQRKSFLYDPYVRFRRLALSLRPSLADGLRGGTLKLEAALPLVLSHYRGLHALAEAQERTARGWFVFGPGNAELAMALAGKGSDVWSRNLEPRQLAELRGRIRAQDRVVLRLPRNDLASLPAEFHRLWDAAATAEVRRAVAGAPQGRLRVPGAPGTILLLWGEGPGGLSDEDRAWVLEGG